MKPYGAGACETAHVEHSRVDKFRDLREPVKRGVLTDTRHPFISGRGHYLMVLKRMIQQLRNDGTVFIRDHDAVEAFKRRQVSP